MSPPVLQCPGCEKTYRVYGSLRIHVRAKHPDKLCLVKTPEADATVNVCPVCDQVFKWHNSLLKHIHAKHPDQRHTVVRKKHQGDYVCHYCSARIVRKDLLKRHIMRLHDFRKDRPHLPPKNRVESTRSYVCPLCLSNGTKRRFHRQALFEHFTDFHQLAIISSEHTFKNINDFKVWKTEIEKNTLTEFVKTGFRKGKVVQFYYRCHRSGRSRLKENGRKQMKSRGSKKMNAFCPAGLVGREFSDGTIRVKFTETHIGHGNELEFVNLKEDERRCVASQIAARIPFDEILKQTREEVPESGVGRKYLLTRKDLHNIAKEFNLDRFKVVTREESLSVEGWVRKLDRDVLFYKRENEWCHSYPSLQYGDLLLVLMTPAQSLVLRQHGSDLLCVDGTQGSNKYRYHAHTLCTVDEEGKAFPSAFLVTNRSDSVSLEIFFQSLKSRLGTVRPRVFLSDTTDLYYRAWSNVMGQPLHRLHSSWHVQRVWRQNLNKIKNPQQKEDTYKILCSLMEEPDKKTFQRSLQSAITNFDSDETTREFGQYMKSFCNSNPELFWAFCYRHEASADINTSINIERMYSNIKHIYNKGQAKGLGNAVSVLLQFVSDRNFERTVSNKGRLNFKIQNAKNAHERSSTVNCCDFVEETKEGWEVKSRVGSETYRVIKISGTDKCCCLVVCSECKICMHSYSCTCIENSNKYNLCEHIHLVATYVRIKTVQDTVNKQVSQILKPDDSKSSHSSASNVSEGNENPDTSHPSNLSIVVVNESESSTKISDQLQRKIESSKEMMNQVFDSVRTEQELNTINEILETLPQMLDAIRRGCGVMYGTSMARIQY